MRCDPWFLTDLIRDILKWSLAGGDEAGHNPEAIQNAVPSRLVMHSGRFSGVMGKEPAKPGFALRVIGCRA